eukprot:Selendium_serpulae@DN6467_c2_g1_i8.p1
MTNFPVHFPSLCQHKFQILGSLEKTRYVWLSCGPLSSLFTISLPSCLTVLHFVDNDPARQCLVKGSSPRVDKGEYAAVITAILIETNARIWFDRVCSDANPVDGLSRNHRLNMESIDVSSQIATSLPTARERIEAWLSKMKTLRVSLSANQGSHDSPFVIQDLLD